MPSEWVLVVVGDRRREDLPLLNGHLIAQAVMEITDIRGLLLGLPCFGIPTNVPCPAADSVSAQGTIARV